MNFSTTPPVPARSPSGRPRNNAQKQLPHSFGVPPYSDSGVNPATSQQNSTEHTRRSATGPAAPSGAGRR